MSVSHLHPPLPALAMPMGFPSPSVCGQQTGISTGLTALGTKTAQLPQMTIIPWSSGWRDHRHRAASERDHQAVLQTRFTSSPQVFFFLWYSRGAGEFGYLHPTRVALSAVLFGVRW